MGRSQARTDQIDHAEGSSDDEDESTAVETILEKQSKAKSAEELTVPLEGRDRTSDLAGQRLGPKER